MTIFELANFLECSLVNVLILMTNGLYGIFLEPGLGALRDIRIRVVQGLLKNDADDQVLILVAELDNRLHDLVAHVRLAPVSLVLKSLLQVFENRRGSIGDFVRKGLSGIIPRVRVLI